MPVSAPIDSQHKAHLVSITSEKENDLVSSLLRKGDVAWIGGTKLSDESWIWIDGSVWSYENWRFSPKGEQIEPNNINHNEDSLVMVKHNYGVWYDFHRHTNSLETSGYVCQYIAF